MRKTTTIAILRFLAVVAIVKTAQGQMLSLDDCIQLALRNNQGLVAADFAVYAAEQGTKETGTLRKPVATFSAGASYAPITGFDPALTEGGEYAGLVELTQPLYEGTIEPAKRQSAVNLKRTTSAKMRAVADIRLEVRLAYFDLMRAQRQYALMQESTRDLESYLDMVRSLAHGGAAPKTDILKVEIQLQSESITLTDLHTAVFNAMMLLLEPLGLPPDTTIAIQDSVALPALPQRLLDNPDLKEFAISIESAELDVKIAQAERLPIISASGSAGAWTSRNQLLGTNSPHVFGYRVGVALGLPMWNWGAITARIEQKVANLNTLCADFQLMRRRYDTAFRTGLQQLQAATEKLAGLDANHQKALEQYQLLQAQYAGGGTSALEVLDSHRTFLEVVLQEEQTRAEINALHAQLLRIAGETE